MIIKSTLDSCCDAIRKDCAQAIEHRYEDISMRQFRGDRPGFQYQPIQFGQQCHRKNKEEDTREWTVEKARRGN